MHQPITPLSVRQRLLSTPYLPLVAYLGLSGCIALASDGHAALPDSVQQTLPMWLAIAWTVAVAVGGCGAVIGALTGWTRTESACLGFLASGAALYAACLVAVTWPHGLIVIALSAAVCSTCGIRMRVLTNARRAAKEATHLKAI